MKFIIICFIILLLTGCSGGDYYVGEEFGTTTVTANSEKESDLFSVSYGDSALFSVVNTDLNVSFVNPVQSNYVITSKYGPRWGKIHQGIDIAVPEGTAIFASTQGYVKTVSYSDTGYGICIEIEYCSSNGDTWMTRYAHLFEIVNLSEGDYVKANDCIAFSGNTGDSTGPHLHFEIFKNGITIDPEIYIDF